MKGRVRANCRFYEDLNRIADQIWILDVNKRIMAKAFAGNEEFFKCVPPELRYFISDGSRIDKIAKDAAKHRRKTGRRGEDFQRFPMRLHQESVGIGGEQGLYRIESIWCGALSTKRRAGQPYCRCCRKCLWNW